MSETRQVRAVVTETAPGGAMLRGNFWRVQLADGTSLRAHCRGQRTTKIPTLQVGDEVVADWIPKDDACLIVFSDASIVWVSPARLERMVKAEEQNDTT